MYYSGVAYCSFQLIDSWTCGKACNAHPGIISVTRVRDDAKDAFGYAAYNIEDNQIIVAFRGTNGADDFASWITNLDYNPITYKNVSKAMVHEGFYTAYLSLKDGILTAVKGFLETSPNA
jgi:hypothetical protein